jgi:predicted PolB exonuclease-like 3'-5' exonuclease
MDTSNRNILVFDIETVGDSLEDYPEDIQNYLTKYSDSEEKKLEIVDEFAFNPLTSKLAAIGMLDHRENKGCVLINAEEPIDLQKNHDDFNYITGSESEIIKKFWEIISAKKYNLFVTFNGRDFDCPFMMLRSLVHKMTPTMNLMKGSDYSFRDYHIDLLKELNFYSHSVKGARRKFTLDFYCRKFGIHSPKTDGVTGDMVSTLFKEKRFQELADYCLGDVIAENELFKFWNEYLNI